MKKKIISKAFLQKKIKSLENELSETKKARDAYGKKIDDQEKEMSKEIQWHIDDKQGILNRIGEMLDDSGYIISSMYDRPVHKTSLSSIGFKIGELMTIKKEYVELKDRTLPVPKMKLVEDEHNRGKRQ